MMSEKIKTIVAFIQKPSYNSAVLDQILAAAAFDYTVQVIFDGEGILELSGPVAPQWAVLPDYGISQVFVTESSMHPNSDLKLLLPFEFISESQAQQAVKQCHWLISSCSTKQSLASEHTLPRLQDEWSYTHSEKIAESLHISFKDTHWKIIMLAREYYKKHQRLPGMRIFVKLCQTQVDEKLDSSILNQLFIGKPLQNIAKLAGLPRPEHCV